MAVAIYLLLCLLVGLCGRRRRPGFGGTFVLALLLTPPVMLVILWLTAPKRGTNDRGAAQAGHATDRRTAAVAERCTCGRCASERNA
jgi:hypothetical protein